MLTPPSLSYTHLFLKAYKPASSILGHTKTRIILTPPGHLQPNYAQSDGSFSSQTNTTTESIVQNSTDRPTYNP